MNEHKAPEPTTTADVLVLILNELKKLNERFDNAIEVCGEVATYTAKDQLTTITNSDILIVR